MPRTSQGNRAGDREQNSLPEAVFYLSHRQDLDNNCDRVINKMTEISFLEIV